MLEGQHGIRDATPIVLTADERSTLESWVRSGLNQVEIWFSILARSTLHGASFSSLAQLRAAIDAFIDADNAAATPFQWAAGHGSPQEFNLTDHRFTIVSTSTGGAPTCRKVRRIGGAKGRAGRC